MAGVGQVPNEVRAFFAKREEVCVLLPKLIEEAPQDLRDTLEALSEHFSSGKLANQRRRCDERAMGRITNEVDPEKMRHLLEKVPRACIAFNNAGVTEVVPVECRFQEGRYWIGMSGAGSGPVPGPGEPVKLLIDEGMYYFDMRGIWIRGRALFSEERPQGGSLASNWFQMVPEKFVAWDFGAMREAKDQ